MIPKGVNFGIVNVEMDGCAVIFWPGLKLSLQMLRHTGMMQKMQLEWAITRL